MEKYIDPNSGKTWIRRDKEEVKFGFLAECIEGMADIYHCSHTDMLKRLEATDLTEGYILKHYDALHTESWEHIMEELQELLNKREAIRTA